MFEKFGNVLRKKSNAYYYLRYHRSSLFEIKRKWILNGSRDKKLEKKWKRYLKKEKRFSHQSQVVPVTEDEAEIVKSWELIM